MEEAKMTMLPVTTHLILLLTQLLQLTRKKSGLLLLQQQGTRRKLGHFKFAREEELRLSRRIFILLLRNKVREIT
jgi:hypothetical protein